MPEVTIHLSLSRLNIIEISHPYSEFSQPILDIVRKTISDLSLTENGVDIRKRGDISSLKIKIKSPPKINTTKICKEKIKTDLELGGYSVSIDTDSSIDHPDVVSMIKKIKNNEYSGNLSLIDKDSYE